MLLCGKPGASGSVSAHHASSLVVHPRVYWLSRFPDMQVACPAGSRAAVSKVVSVDMDAVSLPTRYPGSVYAYEFPGTTKPGRDTFELVFEFAIAAAPTDGEAPPHATQQPQDGETALRSTGVPPADNHPSRFAFVTTDMMFNVLPSGTFAKDFLYVQRAARSEQQWLPCHC